LFRAFLLKASEGRSTPDFSLKSLAGSPGRTDLLARCIISALYSTKGPRRDSRLTVVLEGPPDPPAAVTFEGSGIESVPESEVEAAKMLFDALSGIEIMGVKVERKSFEKSVAELREQQLSIFYLHEEGEDSQHVSFGKDSAFILGDQKGLDPQSERLLDGLKAKRVSLGPHSYLASHCITIVQGELDLLEKS
jgi:tRNA (pseudouridine54-N1)-methyltransferase